VNVLEDNDDDIGGCYRSRNIQVTFTRNLVTDLHAAIACASVSQDMHRSKDAQQFRWPKLQWRVPACAEQPATARTRHELSAFPTSTENISAWELVNPHTLYCLLFCAIEKLLLINALNYFSVYGSSVFPDGG